MGDQPDVRIAGQYYQLAVVDDPTQGTMMFRHPPAERDWQSLFANQQAPSGKPSIENLRNDDLRWFTDDFVGGEGQVVFRADDPTAGTKYMKSVGVDLSDTSQIQLAKDMQQTGLDGTAGTTLQGSTYSDVTGTSTVVGSNRRLNAVGDTIKHNITPAAGNVQVDFYAKVNGNSSRNGSDMTVDAPTAPISGTERQMHDGSKISATVTAQATARATATFTLALTDVAPFGATFVLVVRNQADTTTIATSGGITLGGTSDVTHGISWDATNGTVYKLRVSYTTPSPTILGRVESFVTDYADTKTGRCIIYNETAGTTLASADVDMQGVTTSQKIRSITFTSDGASTYSIRYKYQAGATVTQTFDHSVHTLVGILTPWNAEVGQGNKIWLFDRGAGVEPGAFTWDAQNKHWTAVARIAGAGGSNPMALAFSDYYEYMLSGNGKVYFCRSPATVTAYTAAFTNPLGIAVGANRLYVMTEDTAGTLVYEIALDDTASAPIAVPAVYYQVGTSTSKAKMDPDTTITRRMAGTQDGCVFYVNHGATCTLHHVITGGTSSAPVTDFPVGFKATSIRYSTGLVYIGGGFPAVDTDGATRVRPAVFVVDLTGGTAPIQLDVTLNRAADPGSTLIDMQLYGSDLWVLTEIDPTGGADKKMRVYRCSLTTTGGTFLSQEITTEDNAQSGSARALAVNWRTKVAVFGSSAAAPYLEQETFVSSGTVYLQTSSFNFAISEQKLLSHIQVDGNFPTGTSVDMYYSTDGGTTWVLAGNQASTGTIEVSTAAASVTFHRLALRCVPRTTDNTATPTIYEFSARAELTVTQKVWHLLLDCRNQTASYHAAGQQVRGADLARNILDIVDAGNLVEYVDYYSSMRPEDAKTYRVALRNPMQTFFARGESVIAVDVYER